MLERWLAGACATPAWGCSKAPSGVLRGRRCNEDRPPPGRLRAVETSARADGHSSATTALPAVRSWGVWGAPGAPHAPLERDGGFAGAAPVGGWGRARSPPCPTRARRRLCRRRARGGLGGPPGAPHVISRLRRRRARRGAWGAPGAPHVTQVRRRRSAGGGTATLRSRINRRRYVRCSPSTRAACVRLPCDSRSVISMRRRLNCDTAPW
jgi:hypothetical protein